MKLDINNNILHQLYTVLFVFIFGSMFLFYMYISHQNRLMNIEQKIENVLIKDKLLNNLHLDENNKYEILKVLINGGEYLRLSRDNNMIVNKYFIDKDNSNLDFVLNKYNNRKKDDINNVFFEQDKENIYAENNNYLYLLKEKKENYVYQSNLSYLISLLIIFTLTISLIFFIFKKIKHNQNSLEKLNFKLEDLNKNLEEKVNVKTLELNELNKNLEKKIIEEVDKNREKDNYLIEQSRFIALGEMISNIAHQWRQPLSSISLIIQKISCANMLNETLSKNDLIYIEESITQQIDYMTNTIDIFKNFYNKNKNISKFSINELSKEVLTILGPMLINNTIRLEFNHKEDFEINGSKNELVQVIMNIISNAKDIFEERNIEFRKIIVSNTIHKNYGIIKISDNGGGIQENIIQKIFDPYFTTKHQSRGTGIGLYMSKTIINRDFNGKLLVENKHYGAEFTIIMPLTLNENINI